MELHLSKTHPAPRFKLDWLKGFKSPIQPWQPFIDNISTHGQADVDLMALKDPGLDMDFLIMYQNLVRRNFFNPKLGQIKEIYHLCGAHSLGAFLLANELLHDEMAEIFAQHYDGLFLANPFIGDWYHDHWWARAFSNASINRLQPVGTTSLERLFNPSSTGTDIEFDENPLHQQSLLLHDAGTEFMNKLRAQGGLSKRLGTMPITVLIGNQDPACDNKKAAEFANLIGAKIMRADAGHSALLEDTKHQWAFLNWVEDTIAHRSIQHNPHLAFTEHPPP